VKSINTAHVFFLPAGETRKGGRGKGRKRERGKLEGGGNQRKERRKEAAKNYRAKRNRKGHMKKYRKDDTGKMEEAME
jgi:hypothetical protein